MEVNKIVYTKEAVKDLNYWAASGNKAAQKKIKKIIECLKLDPYQPGIGKPEQLKHDLSGRWSRRINQGNRIVYRFFEDRKEVLIYEVGGHYI